MYLCMLFPIIFSGIFFFLEALAQGKVRMLFSSNDLDGCLLQLLNMLENTLFTATMPSVLVFVYQYIKEKKQGEKYCGAFKYILGASIGLGLLYIVRLIEIDVLLLLWIIVAASVVCLAVMLYFAKPAINSLKESPPGTQVMNSPSYSD